MSTKPQDQAVIVVFRDGVSTEQIKKYADDIEVNGGKVRNRYYESAGGINGFSATVPNQYLAAFKSFQADQINYVEPDQVVTIQI